MSNVDDFTRAISEKFFITGDKSDDLINFVNLNTIKLFQIVALYIYMRLTNSA